MNRGHSNLVTNKMANVAMERGDHNIPLLLGSVVVVEP